ncbi:M23 family metallopeptidase [Candidatus Peregrinibacteria bacterium]|jgi:murein DD-endopeptidase MepM/ murein hydrolase activator NlpD|nr:M23 family metallopeptidase [Candidatus Peregrinibacteria bacterium]
MILSPIENFPLLKNGNWFQTRPRVSQGFGERPNVYKQFGMIGHNGVDFGVSEGTPLFASFDGEVKVKDSKGEGYGLHIKLRSSYRAREAVYGHLSKVTVKSGDRVHLGDVIGFTGNTGFSTGPHLHFGLRHLIPESGDVFKWQVENYNNGYFGYIDVLPWMITFKGTYTLYSLTL